MPRIPIEPRRPKRRGLLRSAAVALGNRPTERGVAALTQGLNDSEPLIRAACAWALGRHDLPNARQALLMRNEIEQDADVRKEIAEALESKL